MADPPLPTTVRVYEAPTEREAKALMERDARAMALRGWMVSRCRWADPRQPVAPRRPRGPAAVLAGLVHRPEGHREQGSLWVVWVQAPIRSGRPELVDGKLSPGGYCRRCGTAREAGATSCPRCGLEAHTPMVGSM